MSRDWREYNEKLVRRGELLIALDFLASWDEELKRMNEGKRGKPFRFPQSFIVFMAYVHRACPFSPIQADGGFSQGSLKIHTRD